MASHRDIYIPISDWGLSDCISKSPCLMSWCKIFSVLPWELVVSEVACVYAEVHHDLGRASIRISVGGDLVSVQLPRSSWHLIVYSQLC